MIVSVQLHGCSSYKHGVEGTWLHLVPHNAPEACAIAYLFIMPYVLAALLAEEQ